MTADSASVHSKRIGNSREPPPSEHGAIGVTAEHRLWLATMRARSWVDESGSTRHYARRLGRMALAADNPWDVVISCPGPR